MLSYTLNFFEESTRPNNTIFGSISNIFPAKREKPPPSLPPLKGLFSWIGFLIPSLIGNPYPPLTNALLGSKTTWHFCSIGDFPARGMPLSYKRKEGTVLWLFSTCWGGAQRWKGRDATKHGQRTPIRGCVKQSNEGSSEGRQGGCWDA